MTASTLFLTLLVVPALLVTLAAPLILLVLLFKDWKHKRLW